MAEYVNYVSEKGPKMFHVGKFTFSTIEIMHLSLAFIAITATLMAHNWSGVRNLGIVPFLILNILTIGFGFVLHELGHKLVAQHYKLLSEFRADFMMLAVSFAMALFSPIIFLAPGAVMIHGRITIRQNGIISVAGPLVNLALAGVFLLLALLFSPPIGSFFGYLLWLGIMVNAFLGVFNMLPFWVLDGKKVLAWSKPVYFSVMGVLVLLLVGSFQHWFI